LYKEQQTEQRYSFISRPTGVDWVPELVEGFLSMEGGSHWGGAKNF
jgi:hypothetical protein